MIDHRTFLGSLVMGTLAVPSVASAQPGRGSSRIFSGRSRDLVFSAARVTARPRSTYYGGVVMKSFRRLGFARWNGHVVRRIEQKASPLATCQGVCQDLPLT